MNEGRSCVDCSAFRLKAVRESNEYIGRGWDRFHTLRIRIRCTALRYADSSNPGGNVAIDSAWDLRLFTRRAGECDRFNEAEE